MRAPRGVIRVLAVAAVITVGILMPSARPVEAASVSAITAGASHTCALTSGVVQCWGSHLYGQLGVGDLGPDPDDQPHPTPMRVPGLTGVTAISAGEAHTCAVTAAGGVACWGSNAAGQLGAQTFLECANEACSRVPINVTGLSSGITAIAAGAGHTCALTTGGGVKCWGWNGSGQLGDNGMCGTFCQDPVQVVGLTSGVIAITAGSSHTCALTSAGAAQCWGLNFSGQLGDGQACGVFECFTPVNVTGLQKDVVALAAGTNHTCAVVNMPPMIGSGTSTAGSIAQKRHIKCWGNGSSGQLGDGVSGMGHMSTTPVDTCANSACASTLAGDQVALGHQHTCARIDGGAVKCWGANFWGQIGNGPPVGPVATPPDVATIANGVLQLSAGHHHTCAHTTSGLQCWGSNVDGQLGSQTGPACGATDCSTVPLTVVLDSDLDGCSDAQEQGSNPALGGMRNAKLFWDFLDTPTNTGQRDAIIATGDIQRVVQRFGTTQVPPLSKSAALAQALSTPPPSGYHAAFDRSPPSPGADPWDLNGPDGSIAVNDILLVVLQFGHTCA